MRMKKFFISLGLVALLLPSLTSAATCPNLSRDLQVPMQGDDVRQLQQFLVETNFLSQADMNTGPGFFGSRTKLAVQRFQSNYGVPTTGYVGPLTRAAIRQVCGGTTPPPIDNNPPPAPTCTLIANPSSIMRGQSSLVSWLSTNASQASITNIGTVAANGSETVFPTQTTTYTGTFWGQGGTAECTATVSVALPGGGIGIGASLGASAVASGLTATLAISPVEIGYCSTAGDQGSISWGDGASVPAGGPGSLWGRPCTATSGTFTLTHTYATAGTYTIVITLNGHSKTLALIVSAQTSCTPEQAQTRTSTQCQSGQTGVITETRTSSCAAGATSPTWGSWTTTSNTCAATGQCLYNGVTYDSGYAAPNVSGGPHPGQYGWNSGHLYVCSAGIWQWKQCGWPNITGPFPNTKPIPTKTGEGRFYYCP